MIPKTPIVLLLLLFQFSDSQLTCHRIPQSFCCTSRIREQCAEQCANVQCGMEFIHSLFSIDGPKSAAKDGSAIIGGGGSGINGGGPSPSPFPDTDTITSVAKPDVVAPIGFNSGDARIQGFAPTPPPTVAEFPTLIPFSTGWTTTTQGFNGFNNQPATQPPSNSIHRRRTTPDPRIIRPPDSLVVIGDYDEDQSPSQNAVVDISENSPPPPPQPVISSNTGDVISRSRKEIATASGGFGEEPKRDFGISETLNSGTGSVTRFYRRGGISTRLSPTAARSNRLICKLTRPGRLICSRSSSPSKSSAAARSFMPRASQFWRGDVRKQETRKIRRNFSTTRVHITPFNGELLRRRRKLDSGSSAEWKVSLIPRGTIRAPNQSVKSIPPFTIDGKSDERFNKFYRTIDKVIDKLELTPNGDLHMRGLETDQSIKLEGNAGGASVESSAVVIVPRTTIAPGTTNKVAILPFRPLHFTKQPKGVAGPVMGPAPAPAPPPQPQPVVISSMGRCGAAPEFKPCVSNEVASRSLLECCQRKNLPAGCQSLCRYDITQAEIRAAMDRGQCGIFNVAPFLECASQGKDNSECCRHRGIVQKTGPQCEQFCRPTQGLTALGIQHIVCGNVVGDMLHCHHSGVRI